MSGELRFRVMAFERTIERIRRIKQDLIANREAEALRISLDALALIKLRIQTKGEAYTGSPFPPYVPGYAKERKASGYQVGYVDFTRTGRMWANVQPEVERSSAFSATVVVRGQSDYSREIIAGAARKRGNILQPSRDEIEFVRQANRQRILKAFGL